MFFLYIQIFFYFIFFFTFLSPIIKFDRGIGDFNNIMTSFNLSQHMFGFSHIGVIEVMV